MSILVVGSVALDTITTPAGTRREVLGGSATHFSIAASFFAEVRLVGVVGEDFAPEHMNLYRHFGINLDGLQVKPGKTFRWAGVYEENMDVRRTILTELNVFASFKPVLPPNYRASPFLFLGNISPDLQAHVLDQAGKPRFTVLDTMDLWITTAADALRTVIRRVDLLTLNESEARHLSGKHSLIKASRRLLELGPRYVLIKKGEHGSILFSKDSIFLMPAYPLEEVQDPTGAGDAFAGGFLGALAAGGGTAESDIRRAMVYGSVIASFGVEAFSLDRLAKLTRAEIDARVDQFLKMARIL